MKKFAMLLPLAASALAPAAIPASAHHSYSMFDMQKTIVLDATVTQFRWQNPHAFIAVEVEEDGTPQRWSIEMTSPNNLVQSGWRRTSLRTGDKIRLWVHPLRSGARGASYIGVRLPDGSTLGDVG